MKFNNKKIKKKIKSKLNSFKRNRDKIERKVKYRKSYKYNFMLVIIVIGFLFFFSSNSIFNSEGDIKVTPYNQVNVMKNNKVMLMDSAYSNGNRLLQVNLRIEKTNIAFDKKILVEVKERANPLEKIETKLTKISNVDYIALVNLPKEWSVVEIKLIEDTEEKSAVKLYVDRRESTEKVDLKEKNINEYMIEFIEKDIENLEKNIEELDKKIEEKSNNISSYKVEINNLEKDKKYLTEAELEELNLKIEQLYSKSVDAEGEIKKIKNEKQEIRKKIEKLEEKKQDYERK